MKTFRLLLALLDRREKRQFVLLVVGSAGSAALSVGGIAAFGAFMRYVANPEIPLYAAVTFRDTRTFLLTFGLATFFLILLGNLSKVATVHAIHRFSGNRRYHLSVRLFRQYLGQPWAFHIERNSNRLSQGLLKEVDEVVNHVLQPVMDAISQGIVVSGILLFLVATSPVLALSAAGFLSIAYSGMYLIVRPRLLRLGKVHWETNGARFTAAGDAITVMKELKVLRLEERFHHHYASVARRHADAEMWLQTIAIVPRHLLEAVAFGLIIVLILVLIAVEGTVAEFLPLLTVFAFAGYRLMPALQVVYSSVARARYFSHTVNQLHRDMHGLSPPTEQGPSADLLRLEPAEPFSSLCISNLYFRYRGSDLEVLQDVNLEVRRNELVAFVGTTGCGKTTLVDIILGLLEPTGGTIRINDRAVAAEARPRGRFGYVPQDIRILDGTVVQNIALGIPNDQIDRGAVERAARIADLHTFVITELPSGYGTVVGERGVRLSGGQRQRLGIARALYLDPEILVFDEATNALDSVTEETVMSAVGALHHHKTIILVAHRLASLRDCDRIYLLDRGRIVAAGTYRELLTENHHFRALAGTAGNGVE